MANQSNASGGIGFFGFLAAVLTAVFIGLKLAGVGAVATWSWWSVISPALIYFSLCFAGLVLVGLFVGIVFIADHIQSEWGNSNKKFYRKHGAID